MICDMNIFYVYIFFYFHVKFQQTGTFVDLGSFFYLNKNKAKQNSKSESWSVSM